MAVQAKLEKCGENGVECVCATPYTQTSHIENELFEDLWNSLSGPPCQEPGGGFFHFHILEGFRGRGASLGYSGTADDADAPERKVAGEIVDAMLEDHNGGVLNLVERLVPCGVEPRTLVAWAKETFRTQGQELGKIPSRLEQCLTIKAALESEGSFEVDSSLFAMEKPAREERRMDGDERCPGYFQIDNYLDTNFGLARWFQKACCFLGNSSPIDATGELPTGKSALKFLLAECLHLWNGRETLSEFSERLGREPPGLAIVPVRILGQYRGAASWFYSGTLCGAACELRDHIKVVAKEVRRWMEPAFDRTMLSATSYRLLQVIFDYGAPEDVAIIGRCSKAQQAFCDLWFANKVSFVTGEDAVIWKQDAPLAYLKTPAVEIEVNIAKREEAIKLLGFEKIVFQCPLFPNESSKEAVEKRVDKALDAVESVARAAQELVGRRARETTETQLSVVAHDLANTMNDIRALAVPSRILDRESRFRLSAIREISDYLSTHAWLMHNMSHAIGGATRNAATRSKLLHFVARDPRRAEFDQWRDYLASRVQQTAMTARWRNPLWRNSRHTQSRRHGTLTAQLRFSVIEASGLAIKDGWETEVWRIEEEDVEPVLRPDLTLGAEPIWPFDPEIRNDRNKLGEHGRIAVLMYGAAELIRNASEHSAQLRKGDPLIDVEVEFRKFPDRWDLFVKTTNRLASENTVKPDISDIFSAGLIQKLAPSAIKFANEPSGDGFVSHSYTFSVKPGLW